MTVGCLRSHSAGSANRVGAPRAHGSLRCYGGQQRAAYAALWQERAARHRLLAAAAHDGGGTQQESAASIRLPRPPCRPTTDHHQSLKSMQRGRRLRCDG